MPDNEEMNFRARAAHCDPVHLLRASEKMLTRWEQEWSDLNGSIERLERKIRKKRHRQDRLKIDIDNLNRRIHPPVAYSPKPNA